MTKTLDIVEASNGFIAEQPGTKNPFSIETVEMARKLTKDGFTRQQVSSHLGMSGATLQDILTKRGAYTDAAISLRVQTGSVKTPPGSHARVEQRGSFDYRAVSVVEAEEIRQIYLKGELSLIEIAARYGYSHTTVRNILSCTGHYSNDGESVLEAPGVKRRTQVTERMRQSMSRQAAAGVTREQNAAMHGVSVTTLNRALKMLKEGDAGICLPRTKARWASFSEMGTSDVASQMADDLIAQLRHRLSGRKMGTDSAGAQIDFVTSFITQSEGLDDSAAACLRNDIVTFLTTPTS